MDVVVHCGLKVRVTNASEIRQRLQCPLPLRDAARQSHTIYRTCAQRKRASPMSRVRRARNLAVTATANEVPPIAPCAERGT